MIEYTAHAHTPSRMLYMYVLVFVCVRKLKWKFIYQLYICTKSSGLCVRRKSSIFPKSKIKYSKREQRSTIKEYEQAPFESPTHKHTHSTIGWSLVRSFFRLVKHVRHFKCLSTIDISVNWRRITHPSQSMVKQKLMSVWNCMGALSQRAMSQSFNRVWIKAILTF